MKQSKQLKHNFLKAVVALLITFIAAVAVTFAWYIYNSSRHTTNVHMAAGAGVNLQISNAYNGSYGQSAILDAFVGSLNPVSTNSIKGGFQKVFGFTNGNENQPNLVASLFGASDNTDYYKTSLYLKTSGNKTKVYLSNIGFEDSDAKKPISTAIRVGFVTHQPGENGAETGEYFFEINKGNNPEAQYNTSTGRDGYVLDSSKTDGTTVPMKTYGSENYCTYNNDTGEVTVNGNSLALCEITGDNGAYGDAAKIDIYIWLEGCDKDCTNNLCAMTLRSLALSFAGMANE